jgi:small GTP-binding protein
MGDQEPDKPKQKNTIKIIVVGSMAVGKTCLITHYQTGKFLSEIPSTCGSSFVQKKKIINGIKYTLNLWDTAGQEKYDSLTKMFTKNANIIILVYSIVDKQSFLDLGKWLKLVKDINGEDGYIIGIAANKSDLYKNSVVSDSQGQEYARKIKAIWKSTSAKEEDRGINILIDELVQIYVKMDKDNNNPQGLKLNNNKKNKKREGGCCKGKGTNTSVDDEEEQEGRNKRINSKVSTISVEENNINKNNDEEDF